MNDVLFVSINSKNRITIRFFLSVFLLCILLIFECSSYPESETGFRVGIVFNEGGKDDMSFNANAWKGAVRARDELNFTLTDVEPGDVSLIEPAVRVLSQQGLDLIPGHHAVFSGIDQLATQTVCHRPPTPRLHALQGKIPHRDFSLLLATRGLGE